VLRLFALLGPMRVQPRIGPILFQLSARRVLTRRDFRFRGTSFLETKKAPDAQFATDAYDGKEQSQLGPRRVGPDYGRG
jgi:hypothetical protein